MYYLFLKKSKYLFQNIIIVRVSLLVLNPAPNLLIYQFTKNNFFIIASFYLFCYTIQLLIRTINNFVTKLKFAEMVIKEHACI